MKQPKHGNHKIGKYRVTMVPNKKVWLSKHPWVAHNEIALQGGK